MRLTPEPEAQWKRRETTTEDFLLKSSFKSALAGAAPVANEKIENRRASPPRLIQQVLQARGLICEEAVESWLRPTLRSLRDPDLLTDMKPAVARLVEARKNQDPVVIYADYDLDGTSALALLLKAFELMGFTDVKYYQPKRLSEGYGLHKAAIDTLFHAEGRRLLISVDLGITAIDEVDHANALGMDVIITDHHLPKERLPLALAVINPNRGNCSSGLGHLCGTGVAFYLALALRRTLLEEGVIGVAFDPKTLLDCFVIGTLTDMVPLVEENRVLVKHGLLALAQTKRPGLRALLEALGLWGNPLTSQDVAIRFAPKLNALSRMEMGLQPIDLYLVQDETRALELVSRVLSNNQDRQASQKSAETDAICAAVLHPTDNSIFVYSPKYHRGVLGLVATKLVQEFGVPSFVGSVDGQGEFVVGSARMPEGLGLNALEAMNTASDLLKQFGGHAAAAGFEVPLKNADQFRKRLDTYFARQSMTAVSRARFYDCVAELKEFDADFMAWYEQLGPFGVQFPVPVFYIPGVIVSEVRALRGGHYRLTLADGGLKRVGLWFSPAKAHALTASELDARPRVDLLAEPQWNYFNGAKTLQLLIQEIRPSRRETRKNSLAPPLGEFPDRA